MKENKSHIPEKSKILEDIRNCYEALACEYDDPDHASIQYNEKLEEPEILRMFGETNPSENDSIMDLGCGTGRWCVSFNEMGYKDLTGFDIAGNMLKEVRRKFEGLPYNPLLIQGNAENVDSYFCPKRFNYVIAPFCDHIPEQEKTFRAVKKILRDDGVFILSYPDKELAETLRPELLGVKVNETRFKLADGKTYTVPSIVHFPDELEILLETAGFSDIEVKQVRVRDRPYVQPTKYIREVARITKKDVNDIPVVMVAKAVNKV